MTYNVLWVGFWGCQSDRPNREHHYVTDVGLRGNKIHRSWIHQDRPLQSLGVWMYRFLEPTHLVIYRSSTDPPARVRTVDRWAAHGEDNDGDGKASGVWRVTGRVTRGVEGRGCRR